MAEVIKYWVIGNGGIGSGAIGEGALF